MTLEDHHSTPPTARNRAESSPAHPGIAQSGYCPVGPLAWAHRVRRLILVGVLVLVLPLGSFAWSYSGYVRSSKGEPTNVLVAEWGRDHHLGWLVAQAENLYYAYVDVTPTGGRPTEPTVIADGAATPRSPSGSAIPARQASGREATPTSPGPAGSPLPARPPAHLRPPTTVDSPVRQPLPNEGVWQPVGATIAGVPAVYATRVRADNVHTSVLASLMWIDTTLADAVFVPGYLEPGGPHPSDGALPAQLRSRVLADFNGAFRLEDSQGGYFFAGQTVRPLVRGAASAVLRADGSVSVGMWGRDLAMASDVVAVRQNLRLIVDQGRSQAGGRFSWGATTHGENFAWRSAVGQRADGSIVYVGSPGLSAAGMADTLVRAGVRRAMVLDMNNWWVAGFYFSRDARGAPVCHKLDPAIQEGCDRFLQPYKRDSFQFVSRRPVDR